MTPIFVSMFQIKASPSLDIPFSSIKNRNGKTFQDKMRFDELKDIYWQVVGRKGRYGVQSW